MYIKVVIYIKQNSLFLGSASACFDKAVILHVLSSSLSFVLGSLLEAQPPEQMCPSLVPHQALMPHSGLLSIPPVLEKLPQSAAPSLGPHIALPPAGSPTHPHFLTYTAVSSFAQPGSPLSSLGSGGRVHTLAAAASGGC